MTMPQSKEQLSLNTASGIKRLLATCAVTLGGMFLLYYPYYLMHLNGLHDMFGHVLGRDFSAIWGAVMLLKQGNVAGIYDPEIFNTIINHFFERPLYFIWPYPPHYFLLLWVLIRLPYAVALYTWLLSGSLLLLWVVRKISRWDFPWIFLLLGSPAWLYNFFVGQNGFVTAALLAGGLLLIRHRPFYAALFIAALTIKPQLGLAIPVLLLAERQWKMILQIGCVVSILAGITILFWGVDPWIGCYEGLKIFKQTLWLDGAAGEFRFISSSASNSLILLGMPPLLATLCQMLITITALVYFYRLVRTKHMNGEHLFILTILTTFIASPYLSSYDMVCVAIAALLWLRESMHNPLPRKEIISILILWIMPVATILFNKAGLPATPLLFIYVFWVFSSRLKALDGNGHALFGVNKTRLIA